MRRFRHVCWFCCAAALAGCAGSDSEGAADTAAAATAAMAGPAPLSLDQLAGRWNVRAIPLTGDTTPTTLVMTATADTTGWTTTFPNREPIPMRIIAVSGDSAVAELGPYESARRRGVQTVTRFVMRLQGDQLTGNAVAHYTTTGPDSVLHLRMEGTRAP